MNLAQISQESSTDRYGERDQRFEGLLLEVAHYREQGGQATGQPLPFILTHIPPHSKVLEFGPAAGYMTRYLKEQLHCDVTIVELDPDCAASASEFASKCFLGNIDDQEWHNWLQGEQFDIITFCDVLEHLKAPWDILKKATTHLKKEGSLFCSIPNVAHHTIIAHLLENKFEYFSCGLLDITHLRFFTAHSLKDMFRYCGLGVRTSGNTQVTTLSSNPMHPWAYKASTPLVAELQKKLTSYPQHQIFQYVTELKFSSWLKENNILEQNIAQEEQFIDEQELYKEKLKKIDSLQQQLVKITEELSSHQDHLHRLLTSKQARCWNKCLKWVAALAIIPQLRRHIRNTYSLK